MQQYVFSLCRYFNILLWRRDPSGYKSIRLGTGANIDWFIDWSLSSLWEW